MNKLPTIEVIYNDENYDDIFIYRNFTGMDNKMYVETYRLVDSRNIKNRSKEQKIRFNFDVIS